MTSRAPRPCWRAGAGVLVAAECHPTEPFLHGPVGFPTGRDLYAFLQRSRLLARPECRDCARVRPRA